MAGKMGGRKKMRSGGLSGMLSMGEIMRPGIKDEVVKDGKKKVGGRKKMKGTPSSSGYA